MVNEESKMSIWQQLSDEQEMHFHTCVNDVIAAIQYHGLPAILNEIAKNETVRQQLDFYLTNMVEADILNVH
jgi:hypothetical protein